jgi:peptidoglycan/xylan/chitin deacetylase (PgdA/CDA1 family)
VLGASRSPGKLPWIVADVTAPHASKSLRDAGEARAEALGVLLRREGTNLEWGEPIAFRSVRDLARFSRARGRSSVALVRTDPSLLPDLQLGSWFDVRWRFRLLRRLAARAAPILAYAPGSRLVTLALDAAFWAGVRSAATAREWRRLTRSSYTALYYHRIAGEGKPGQERMDISPAAFARQLRLLRRLRFRPLSADEVLAFHERPDAILPRRAYALTVDDGFRDAVDELRRHPEQRAQVFVCTGSVGGRAEWAAGEPLADWGELAESGAAVGSHATSHVDLTRAERLDETLVESRRELERRLARPATALAYPHGRRNDAVRRAAAAAGYRVAWTTDPGRTGAGTGPYDLRRVGPKEWDSTLSFLWKVVTGELVPARWERRLLARARRRSRSRPSSGSQDAPEGAGRSAEGRPRREQP